MTVATNSAARIERLVRRTPEGYIAQFNVLLPQNQLEGAWCAVVIVRNRSGITAQTGASATYSPEMLAALQIAIGMALDFIVTEGRGE